MSVKITWLRIACDIFGMGARHLTSTAVMEEIDHSPDRLSANTFAPARLAMSENVLQEDRASMDDVFISQLDCNWMAASSIMELPPKSIASSICAWLSTLHLIVDRYSEPCGIYVATPICLKIPSISAELPGAMYLNLKSVHDDWWVYVLVPHKHKQAIVKLDRKRGGIYFEAGCDLWTSISASVYDSQADHIGGWLGSPFGYNMTLRKTDYDWADEDTISAAEIEFYDLAGWKALQGLAT